MTNENQQEFSGQNEMAEFWPERRAFEEWLGMKPIGQSQEFAWRAWNARATLGHDELRKLIQDGINTVAPPKNLSYRQTELFKAGARAVIAKINGILKGQKP